MLENSVNLKMFFKIQSINLKNLNKNVQSRPWSGGSVC